MPDEPQKLLKQRSLGTDSVALVGDFLLDAALTRPKKYRNLAIRVYLP
jgi:hypothetical protein